jgi:hypothetical protein
MERLTFSDIVRSKRISKEERVRDLVNLKKFKADSNDRKFCGNPFLYHHQMENLCKTRVGNRLSLFEIMEDDEEYLKLWTKTQKLGRTGSLANRLFEAERFNGAVVMFKASTAKFLYKKFGATSVLDPTAGWGGRMLGAWSLGIPYTGIDTNVSMKPSYDAMIEELGADNLKMIWNNCLDVDYSALTYDFVLTSPPYINLEQYQHMPLFVSKKAFYTEWLIPLLTKLLLHIAPGGHVCFNISPMMYSDLLVNGFRACDEEYDLLQQKRLGKDKQDKIYIWRKLSAQT